MLRSLLEGHFKAKDVFGLPRIEQAKYEERIHVAFSYLLLWQVDQVQSLFKAWLATYVLLGAY